MTDKVTTANDSAKVTGVNSSEGIAIDTSSALENGSDADVMAPKSDSPQALSAAQVAEYLRTHPEFFESQTELLADLRLPHESGKAISLLERQVVILRERGQEARQKLGSLLANARDNDQLFDVTRDLVLSLLRARDATEVAEITQDKLTALGSVDACEIIVVARPGLKVSEGVRTENAERLAEEFADVFRLRRTHCGAIPRSSIENLFGATSSRVGSTALCPIMHESEIIALLALGNESEDYFNTSLDTLFLDFIGHVVGAILHKSN
jgi:uncharacterized protein YigA (DUF484 family)